MKKHHPIRPHLRPWRLHFGRTLEWLANETGTTHTTVMRWERGSSGVDDATFAAIAKAYGITVAELSAAPKDAERARQLHRLLTAAPLLDTESLATLAGLAERLKPRQ